MVMLPRFPANLTPEQIRQIQVSYARAIPRAFTDEEKELQRRIRAVLQKWKDLIEGGREKFISGAKLWHQIKIGERWYPSLTYEKAVSIVERLETYFALEMWNHHEHWGEKKNVDSTPGLNRLSRAGTILMIEECLFVLDTFQFLKGSEREARLKEMEEAFMEVVDDT